MKRWMHIIVSLLLVMGMATGAMVHAAEMSSVSCSSATVFIDDCVDLSNQSDEQQPDPADTSVNCNGCHGHQIAIPAAAAASSEPKLAVQIAPAPRGSSLSPSYHTDTFRPPIL